MIAAYSVANLRLGYQKLKESMESLNLSTGAI